MNKELIKKYKDEFNYWLDGGDVVLGFRDLFTNKIRWYPSIKNPFSIESTSSELLVVIKDKFFNYRKAFIEGKIVEFKHPNVNYHDWELVTKDHIFQSIVPGRKYRIK